MAFASCWLPEAQPGKSSDLPGLTSQLGQMGTTVLALSSSCTSARKQSSRQPRPLSALPTGTMVPVVPTHLRILQVTPCPSPCHCIPCCSCKSPKLGPATPPLLSLFLPGLPVRMQVSPHSLGHQAMGTDTRAGSDTQGHACPGARDSQTVEREMEEAPEAGGLLRHSSPRCAGRAWASAHTPGTPGQAGRGIAAQDPTHSLSSQSLRRPEQCCQDEDRPQPASSAERCSWGTMPPLLPPHPRPCGTDTRSHCRLGLGCLCRRACAWGRKAGGSQLPTWGPCLPQSLLPGPAGPAGQNCLAAFPLQPFGMDEPFKGGR